MGGNLNIKIIIMNAFYSMATSFGGFLSCSEKNENTAKLKVEKLQIANLSNLEEHIKNVFGAALLNITISKPVQNMVTIVFELSLEGAEIELREDVFVFITNKLLTVALKQSRQDSK